MFDRSIMQTIERSNLHIVVSSFHRLLLLFKLNEQVKVIHEKIAKKYFHQIQEDLRTYMYSWRVLQLKMCTRSCVLAIFIVIFLRETFLRGTSCWYIGLLDNFCSDILITLISKWALSNVISMKSNVNYVANSKS